MDVTFGVIGTAAIALHAARRVYEFTSGIQGAPEAINNISRDVRTLSNVLETLQTVFQSAHPGRGASQSTVMAKLDEPLNSCVNTLRDIEVKISPYVSSNGQARRWQSSKGSWKSLKWTFREKDVLALQATLASYKQTLDIAISIAEFSNNRADFAEVKEMINGIVGISNEETKSTANNVSAQSEVASTEYQFAVRRWLDETETTLDESEAMHSEIDSDEPLLADPLVEAGEDWLVHGYARQYYVTELNKTVTNATNPVLIMRNYNLKIPDPVLIKRKIPDFQLLFSRLEGRFVSPWINASYLAESQTHSWRYSPWYLTPSVKESFVMIFDFCVAKGLQGLTDPCEHRDIFGRYLLPRDIARSTIQAPAAFWTLWDFIDPVTYTVIPELGGLKRALPQKLDRNRFAVLMHIYCRTLHSTKLVVPSVVPSELWNLFFYERKYPLPPVMCKHIRADIVELPAPGGVYEDKTSYRNILGIPASGRYLNT